MLDSASPMNGVVLLYKSMDYNKYNIIYICNVCVCVCVCERDKLISKIYFLGLYDHKARFINIVTVNLLRANDIK